MVRRMQTACLAIGVLAGSFWGVPGAEAGEIQAILGALGEDAGFTIETFASNNDNVGEDNTNMVTGGRTAFPLTEQDLIFSVSSSGGTTEYLFSETISTFFSQDSNLAFPFPGFQYLLGFGAGDAFVQSDGFDSLDFDLPDQDPAPTGSVASDSLSDATNFGDILSWGGIIPPELTADFTFSLDVPDLGSGDPYEFTLRRIPAGGEPVEPPGSTPDNPILPENQEDGPPWNFRILEIPDGAFILYLDPLVAIGYDYEMLSGPNFNSVLLPSVGDGLFDLYLSNGTDYLFDQVLSAELEHLFEPGGVGQFRILGIEPSAGLDPNDPTAFVTGLSFVNGAQDVRLRMTPLTQETQPIPEPGTWLLFGLGGGVVLARRRLGAGLSPFRPTRQ